MESDENVARSLTASIAYMSLSKREQNDVKQISKEDEKFITQLHEVGLSFIPKS